MHSDGAYEEMEQGSGEAGDRHGTVKLETGRLVLRRYRIEDAEILYRELGRDEAMSRYSGWNSYATEEMAEATVRKFIDSYRDDRFYGWAVEYGGILVGTAGAYDYDRETDSIEVGISIIRSFWGHGFASEALTEILRYLTKNEGIGCVKAWCAAENTGSAKAMEKAGMKQVGCDAGGLSVGEKSYDRLLFEYRDEM